MTALPTREERASAGAEARARVPPSVYAAWKPRADRADPIALLQEQDATRIPELVPVRYGRMAISPFTFYRGAALTMAADLAGSQSTGLKVQLAGDAHLSNFGLFASPERDLVFDMNDFDETHPGPWEWDVARLAGSLVVAARERGFDAHDARHAVHAAVHSYREKMADYAAMRAIDVYYAKVDAAEIEGYVDKRARPYLQSTVKSAAHHDALHELPKLTAIDEAGRRKIVDHPPTISHPADLTAPVEASILAMYRTTLQEDRRILFDRYEPIDAALKVVGVGSVGLGAFAVLFEGGGEDDPLFLQVKQAEASILERFLGPSTYSSHGERVVAGQRRLQAASDVMLGWAVGPGGRHLYIRQLQDQKASAIIEAMTFDDLVTWGRLCGWGLAGGHARTGEPATLGGYLGTDNEIDHAIADFAVTYADQTERDHAALVAAIKSGRVAAEPGV